MTRRKLIPNLAVLLAVVLVGCGGGDGGEADEGAAAPTVDEDIAQAVNLRLTDFPGGWERQPAALRRPDSPEDLRFSACMGRPPARELRTALADSDNFATGQLTRANSSVQVMRNAQLAQDDLAALRTPVAIPCLRERLDTQLATQNPPNGPPYQQRALERLESGNVGDEAVAFRATVAAPSVSPTAVLFVDLVFARKGRVEVSTSFVDLDQPFPADLSRSLLAKLLERAPPN